MHVTDVIKQFDSYLNVQIKTAMFTLFWFKIINVNCPILANSQNYANGFYNSLIAIIWCVVYNACTICNVV